LVNAELIVFSLLILELNFIGDYLTCIVNVLSHVVYYGTVVLLVIPIDGEIVSLEFWKISFVLYIISN